MYYCIATAAASTNKKDLATGLEWNDPMHINVIPRPEDRRRLCLILIKIAQFSNLPLFPYFQDYEIVSFVPRRCSKNRFVCFMSLTSCLFANI